MSLTRKPLTEIDSEDIRQLCEDQEAEGHELELKQQLPASRDRPDPWIDGQNRIGEYARNEIAKEVIAFANTFGGTVVVGIEETEDRPSRASSIRPLPQVHELARRLRQSVYAIIDPPLPILETAGVVTEPDETSGVVVLRVPPSRRRPHRSNANKEVYVRRVDESAVIDMRQIQELTIHALAEARRIEEEIARVRNSGRNDFLSWLGTRFVSNETGGVSQVPNVGMLFQLAAVPTGPIDLGRVANRPSVYPEFPAFNIQWDNVADQASWPFSTGGWQPKLRSVVSEYDSPGYRVLYRLRTDGICELQFQQRASDDAGYFISWLTGAYAGMLYWIERVRRVAGAPGVEFALATTFSIVGAEAILGGFGAQKLRKSYKTLPIGTAEFPIQSVGEPAEFALLLQGFNEDVWNHAGADVQRSKLTVDFGPLDRSLHQQ